MGSSLALDQNFLCMFFSIVTFFRKFFDVSNGSSFNLFFDILRQNGCSKNPKGSPFYIFRHYETVQNFFQKNSIVSRGSSLSFSDISHQIGFSKRPKPNFCPKFSQVFSARYNRILFVFKTGIFSMGLSNLFISKPPLNFYKKRNVLRV